MINGNLVGFGMLILSALLIALPGYLLRWPNAVTMSGVGVLLIAADLILRMRNKGQRKWLTGDQTGGYLFFIPVWIFGIAMIFLNIVNALFIRK
jgi:phosphate/sulfate permease